jgi:hypothetical protein
MKINYLLKSINPAHVLAGVLIDHLFKWNMWKKGALIIWEKSLIISIVVIILSMYMMRIIRKCLIFLLSVVNAEYGVKDVRANHVRK